MSLVTPVPHRSPPQPGVPDVGWRVQRLLLAPHRLGFALAVLLLCVAALWWATVLLDRATGALALPLAVSPSLGHAAVMTWGFLPLFFAGFLFTAGPKWLGVAAPNARSLVVPLVLQAAGWLVWLAGIHLYEHLAVAGAVLALLGLAWVVARFWALVRASTLSDRVHARLVAWAGTLGVASLALMAGALAAGAIDLARVAALTALWGFVVTTFVAVAHRMIPFFTSSAVPMVHAWRPFWVLWVLLAAVALEGVAVWWQWLEWPGGAADTVVRLALGTLEIAAGAVVIWLGVVWGLVQSLKVRLLAMLHLGFVWLGLAFLLAGATQWLSVWQGAPVLGLGALHALTMGCLGSLMLAMVTRVSCGHSGRTLVADDLVWALFWSLQLATLLRIAGAAQAAPPAVMWLAALLWATVMTVWGLRMAGWYGRPRSDGRPG